MSFRIENHKLVSDDHKIEYRTTKKKSGQFKPGNLKYLVLHFTAGASYSSSMYALADDPGTVGSAHLTIGRNGEIGQIGDFRDILWHAGKSSWKGLTNLNSYSIGIEVDCPGEVSFLKTENDINYYKAYFYKPGSKNGLYNDKDDVIVKAKHAITGGGQYWVQYTPIQIDLVEKIGKLLMDVYNLKEAVGHDQIAPNRKTDPGPCCPKSVFDYLNHGSDKISIAANISTTTVSPPSKPWMTVKGTDGRLNIRDNPNGEIIGTVDEGKVVANLGTNGDWMKIRNDAGVIGWSASRYLK